MEKDGKFQQFKVYRVGGSVRDQLLGYGSNDNDFVVVSARPEDMIALGFTSGTVGSSFAVFLDKNGDQYALARREKKDGTGYNGFKVDFDPTVTLEEDLFRRDLTCNALAQDIGTGEIIDPFGGREDLNNRVLRHVSPAFSEDPLRVIRLARFYARWVEFKIHPSTELLARNLVCSGELDALSDERFWAELVKVFDQGGDPYRFFLFLEEIEALSKVKFFRDLFGDAADSRSRMLDARTYISSAQAYLKVADRLRVFVALFSSRDAKQVSSSIPTDVKVLTKNMKRMLDVNFDWNDDLSAATEAVFSLLASMRAFSSSNEQVNDVILATKIAESAGGYYKVTSSMLETLALVTRAVSSAPFSHLSGKEIGSAIAAVRAAEIKKVLEDFHEGE